MADVWVGYNTDSNNNSASTDKSVTAGCSPPTGSTYLELNNVKALIMTGGDMWWGATGDGNAKYEVPKGSGKHANFASSIWIGGTDINNQLRLCGMRYRSEGYDYWPGPLVSSGEAIATVTTDVCRKYDRHFVINKKEVKEFRQWFDAKANGEEYDEDYQPPLSITEWPAHGPVEYGAYDWNLAPFRDIDGDGVYDPTKGDYPRFEFSDDKMPCGTSKEEIVPRLYGDQSMWWVYNDNGNVHTETKGQAIGMELRGQAFAFSSNDELNNMTFYNFEIINRSTYTLKNTYFAVFTDADIGDSQDDLCGCDVAKGLGFMYNGDPEDGDGTGRTYGSNPPAIGVDFFEGPFMDASDDHLDRPSAYIIDENHKRTDELDPNAGPAEWYNGSINGLNFGDNVPDNERWGMRRFIYYNNSSANNGDPDIAIQYYNYLKGIWKDNSPLKYGGDGFSTATDLDANFMFPGLSDITNWGTEGTEPADKDWTGANSDTPSDKRFVHSAGPFTLMPGAINYITTGVVWARAYSTNPYKSVELVIQADEKAQKLFEACFEVIDGPDAPELDFIEDNNSFIVNLWNKKGSNNFTDYPEDYSQESPFITCPIGADNCDKDFTFEGYIVYQLASKDVSVNDIDNSDLARVVFQCDVKNDIANIMNYEYNANLQATEPKLKVVAENDGLKHSFKLTKDLFASSTNNKLINYKKYYYVVVAYAYNNYKNYDPTDASSLDGQKEPFLIGRNNIKIFTKIPHPLQQNEGGTTLNSYFGESLAISQVDGYGCGTNVLELKDETVNRILSNTHSNRIDSLNYKTGFSPITVKVVDPLNIKEEDFQLRFYDLQERDVNNSNNYYNQNGYIGDAKWFVIPLNTWSMKRTDTIFADTTNTDILELVPVYGYDTIFSDNFITSSNEQTLIYNSTKYGLSVKISQTLVPGQNRTISENDVVKFTIDKNGYLESSMEFSNGEPWLTFVRDIDEGFQYRFNWIKSGKVKAGVGDTPYDDYTKDGKWYDADQDFENILNGAWAPGALASEEFFGKASDDDLFTFPSIDDNGYFTYNGVLPKGICLTENMFGGNIYRYASVDIVITKDKSKWTRCPVVETCNNNHNSNDNSILPGESIGDRYKFLLRASKSVDKNGNTSTSDELDTLNVDSPNFMGSYGMGWFPGYAIDVETGERLNIMFGEDSHFKNQNSQDMLWNPTSDQATDLFWNSNGLKGEIISGGKHFIYVMGRNYMHNEVMNEKSNYYSKSLGYDYGRSIHDTLSLADNVNSRDKKYFYAKNVYQNAMWISMPLLRETTESSDANDPYSFIKSDVKVRIRVANPFRKDRYSYVTDYDSLLNVYSNLIYSTVDFIGNLDFHYEKQIAAAMHYADSVAVNGNLPMYHFSSKGLSANTNQTSVAKDALYMVKVVPNPYYAFNEYETSPIDHRIKFINLPNTCTIRIYNVGGTLIKTLKKDNNLTFTDWNLKNEYGISISGGVYIIHVDAPGIGEKVLKWFGALRPIDLNNF